jgi:hypothetical protein
VLCHGYFFFGAEYVLFPFSRQILKELLYLSNILNNPRTLFLRVSITEFFFFFGENGVWTQGFALAKQALYCLSHMCVHFALVILEVGSCELFAWLGLKPQSSDVSLPSSSDYRREHLASLTELTREFWVCVPNTLGNIHDLLSFLLGYYSPFSFYFISYNLSDPILL